MHKAHTAGVILVLTFGLTSAAYAQSITKSLAGDQLSCVTLYLEDVGILGGYIPVSDENSITIEPSLGGKIAISRDSIMGIRQGRSAITDIENRGQQYEKPPLNMRRISGEIIAGSAGGFAVGVPCARIGSRLTYDPNNWLGALFGGLIGWRIGCSLGTAAGVYLVGTRGNATGSFLATWSGAFVGVLCALPAGEISSTLADIAFFAGPPIVATYCFNVSRRYEYSPAESETALINVRDGRTSLAIPRVHFRPDSFGSAGLCQSVDLVKVRF